MADTSLDGVGLRRVKVWDGWVRLFHWSVVILLGVSWWTYEQSQMEWHALSGYAILTLVLFRLGWGLFGSESARFSRFLRSPLEALRHLRDFPKPEPDTEVSHNAAGGYMVLVLLGLLLFQAVTGLFANDDSYTFEGPLAHFVGKPRSDWFTGLHHRGFLVIELAVVLHVLAVGAYALLKGHDLVRPMITGHKLLPGEAMAPRLASPILALLLFGVAVLIVFGIARQAG